MKKINFIHCYYRIQKWLEYIKEWLSVLYARYNAHQLRIQVVKSHGETFINPQLRKKIKEYARHKFGSKGYWQYLALYTEIRGEFIEGWIPYDYFRYKLLPIYNPNKYSNISFAKTLDYRIFGEFAIKPLFLHITGLFYGPGFEPVNVQELVNFLKNYKKKIVIKEDFGMGGKQVKIIHSSEFIPDMLNKKVNHIIQPYIEQYKVLNDLHPSSVNTFRVNTFLEKDGAVTVKFVVLRFGINNNFVDNGSSGGEFIYFDHEGNPSEQSFAFDDGLWNKKGISHINTGLKFSEIKIPMFNDILQKCKDAHLKYPYIRLIGWDVCVDSTGTPKLIEWNAVNPAFWDYEAIFGPLWMDIEKE